MDTPLDLDTGMVTVAAGYSPEMTARYRDEVQGLLHSLFDGFLRRQEPRLHDVLKSARGLAYHGQTRCRLRGVEQTHREARNHHLNRKPKMGRHR